MESFIHFLSPLQKMPSKVVKYYVPEETLPVIPCHKTVLFLMDPGFCKYCLSYTVVKNKYVCMYVCKICRGFLISKAVFQSLCCCLNLKQHKTILKDFLFQNHKLSDIVHFKNIPIFYIPLKYHHFRKCYL